MTSTEQLRRTREEWLEEAICYLRPRFAEIGLPLPEQIHVSVGFGYGARRESAKILGQTWAREASRDGVNHVFISPEIADTREVLATLVHELIHVADDCVSGHRGRFAEVAVRLGLEGPMTATVPGVSLEAELVCMAETLGRYPHGALEATRVRAQAPTPGGTPGRRIHSGPAKQGNRNIICVCGHCGYRVRTTRTWLARGFPRCPDGQPMRPVD